MTERQKGDLVERQFEQIAYVSGFVWQFINQIDALQIFRGNRKRYGIANRFVKTVVGAVLIKVALRRIGHLVIIVPEFVMHGDEIFIVDFDTHFDAHIFLGVHIPGAGVTDDFAVLRLGKQRALPEGRRQRLKAQRGKKAFAVSDHLFGIGIFAFE